jgi:hypothetical protein
MQANGTGSIRTTAGPAGAAGGGGSGIQTYANRGFIQWAGITAGLAVSFFDFYVTPRYSNTTNVLGSDSGGAGILVFAYTAQFGNGLSASISAEDTTFRQSNTSLGSQTYAGRQWPDIVGNLRIDQAWGSAQVMGAVHQVRGVTTSDTAGWAVGAGVKVNLPWAKGDSFTIQGTYAKGAIGYVGSGLSTFTVSENGTSIAYFNTYDAITNATGGLELTEGWSVVAGADHRWNNMWKTSLYGTYGEINFNGAATTAINGGGVGSADSAFWQVGSRTVWTPVQNLDISVDIMYNQVNSAQATVAGGNVTGSDVGWLQGMFRFQRNFWP